MIEMYFILKKSEAKMRWRYYILCYTVPDARTEGHGGEKAKQPQEIPVKIRCTTLTLCQMNFYTKGKPMNYEPSCEE